MIIIFHFDLDGHTSAAIIKYKYQTARCIEMNYGYDIPWEDLKDEIVYIVDFSFKLEDMKRIMKEAKKVIWIDHHVSVINDLQEISSKIPGLRDVEETYSGCELTWKYIFPHDPMPRAVHLLGRYDVWDHSDSDIIPFQYAMQARDTDPNTCMNLWCNLINDYDNSEEMSFLERDSLVDKLVREGKIIQRYLDKKNTGFIKNNAMCVELDGYKFFAVNGYLGDSIALEKGFDLNKYDAMMTFRKNKDNWVVGLYGVDGGKVDCSEVAKHYKGGGHKNSSGFTCKELPFKI